MGGVVSGGIRVKVASAVIVEFMVSVHVGDVPEHPPDHPEKVEPAAGVAVRVTGVPAAKVVPVGLLVTVPLPVPSCVTVRV